MVERGDTSLWFPDLNGRNGPLYRGLADAVAAAVRDGVLRAGDKLPPHRVMAARLGVDLTTVTRGYAEAQRLGLLQATVGRGTFVRAEAPLVRQRGRTQALIDMSMNLPPLPADPSLHTMIQQGLARLLREQDLSTLMTYHWDTGSSQERRAGIAWLQPVLGRIEAPRVLVAPGAQSAMLAVVTSLVRPGELMLTEQLTYPGIRAMAAQLGVTLAGVATDGEGFLPEELDRACHDLKPRLIYCTPTIQNPTTATMSMARRRAVVEVARAHGVPILEDDAYGLFPAQKLPALASLAPELVFYVATTAKTLSPGLRIAYLIAPVSAQADRLTAALRGTAQMSSGLLTGLVTSWILGGEAQAMLNAIRSEARARQSLAASILKGDHIVTHPDGLHLWMGIPPDWQPIEFVAYARRQGLALVTDDVFRVEGRSPRSVRIALGAAATRSDLQQSLEGLQALYGRPVPDAYAEVV